MFGKISTTNGLSAIIDYLLVIYFGFRQTSCFHTKDGILSPRTAIKRFNLMGIPMGTSCSPCRGFDLYFLWERESSCFLLLTKFSLILLKFSNQILNTEMTCSTFIIFVLNKWLIRSIPSNSSCLTISVDTNGLFFSSEFTESIEFICLFWSITEK